MKIFDLHCDTILACETGGKKLYQNDLHIDLQKMRQGGALAQCFAVFLDQKACMESGKTPYQRYREILQYFKSEIEENKNRIASAYHAEDIRKNELAGKMSAILTVEGGEVLEGDLRRLDDLRQDGVRLMTLTWNYENEIGFPHCIGGGLKTFGFEVVKRMNELGMLIDVSHLSDEGFWDVLCTSVKPIVASHSCARSLCRHSRNLTDEMMHALGNQGGVVGVNFYSKFLNDRGIDSTCEMVLAHARKIVSEAGIEALALGSDFDGIDGSLEWKDYSGMQMLVDYLHKEFTWDQLDKICYQNALRVFEA